jgi:CO/xanthine dehydrogenase FAD-binding subunit
MAWLAYEQVARSPIDRPIVCAAAGGDGQGGLRLSLGGFGRRPILVPIEHLDPGEAAEAAASAYREAGDAWADADYRSEVAGVLARRVTAQAAGR